ncbi:hypothetical protein Golomagni_06924 [Golovinomyces magnicellulatus]|nr:hypothetical protein Golomagni_06924 [Golovinomyces magnicellulatus]
MPFTQVRAARLSSQMAKHVTATRYFSTGAVLRKEIQDAYILSAARTPTAKFNGSYLGVSAPKLGATAIKSALEKSKVPVEKITDVYMGNVLQASVGQAPARQATIFAGLPESVEAITINKVCASGLKAVAFAAQNIQLGLAEAQIAGGMENMSQVPYYVNRSSSLPAFGHVKMEDGLIKDGLTDVYDQFHMGNCCENTVKTHGITREQQDEYAIQSYRNAQKAWADKAFADEIAPVTVKNRKGETIIDTDEGFKDIKFEKVPTLKPAFVRDGTGTVTAANSSTLNDGASALVIGSKAIAQEYGSGSRVLAKICSYADAAMAPIDFPVAPAKAVPIALERAGITKDQVAIWEFNEAFAGVILANAKILGLAKDIHINNHQFNQGLAVYYATYIASEIPSNLVLKKISAKIWLPVMTVAWGIVTVGLGFVRGYGSFIAVRAILGLAEGGLLPGFILYLSGLYNRGELALRIGIFYTAASLSGAFGGKF